MKKSKKKSQPWHPATPPSEAASNQHHPGKPAELGEFGVDAGFRRLWLALMLVATSLPYLLEFFGAPAGRSYTWILPPYPDDSIAYMAWSRQALNGQLLFSLKYSAIPHEPFMLQPFFLLAGWLGALTGWSLGFVHFLLKGAGVALFFHAFFGFLGFLRVPRPQARLASLLLGLSSGVGAWIYWILGSEAVRRFNPADLWLVDLDTYWSLLWNPLFPYSLTLILSVARWILEGSESRAAACWWKAGAGAALLTLIHPYHIPFLYLFFVVLAVARLPRAEWLGAGLRFFGVSAPFVAHSAWQSWAQPLLARHSITGRMESPALGGILLGCGLPLIFAALGALDERKRLQRLWPLLLWIGLAFGLAYAPFWFQRKFFFGLHIPLCVLAAYGMQQRLRKPAGRWILLGIMATTPLYLIPNQLRQTQGSAPDSPYFIPDDLMGALDYLRTQSRPEEIVFATYNVSRLIPAYAGNTVVWGHWAQSVDAREQGGRLQAVFSPASGLSDEQRAAEFWKGGVRYALLDPSLKSMLGNQIPGWLYQGTQVVWEKGGIQILKKG